MQYLSQALVPMAVAIVVIVLVFGLWNMLRGGPGNNSQQLMRTRVLAQLAAVVIIMAAIWMTGR